MEFDILVWLLQVWRRTQTAFLVRRGSSASGAPASAQRATTIKFQTAIDLRAFRANLVTSGTAG